MQGDEVRKEIKIYTLPECAKLLEIGEHTLRTWIKRGKLRAMKVANRFHIREDDLIKFLNKYDFERVDK